MTKTYYQRNTKTYQSTDTYRWDFALTTAAAGTVTETIPANTTNGGYFQYITNQGEPGLAAWPYGDYVFQVNVVATGADLTWRYQFTRALSSGTYSAWGEFSSTLSGTGLQAGTVTTTPPGSNADDRFLVYVVLNNANTMKSQDQSHEVNTTNSYGSGPWTVGATSLPPIPPRFHLIRR